MSKLTIYDPHGNAHEVDLEDQPITLKFPTTRVFQTDLPCIAPGTKDEMDRAYIKGPDFSTFLLDEPARLSLIGRLKKLLVVFLTRTWRILWG